MILNNSNTHFARHFFIVVASIFFTITCQAQLTFENIDTSRSSLKGIDTVKSCQLATKMMTAFIKGGNADNLASSYDVPITVEGTTYSTTSEVSDFLAKVIKGGSASKDNPKVKKSVVLGRRQEMLNGIVQIDILYVLGGVEFDIDGRRPIKLFLFAIRNPSDPRIIGLYAE